MKMVFLRYIDYTKGDLKWAEDYIRASEIQNKSIKTIDIGHLFNEFIGKSDEERDVIFSNFIKKYN